MQIIIVKSVHQAVNLCTLGAGCTLNFKHWKGFDYIYTNQVVQTVGVTPGHIHIQTNNNPTLLLSCVGVWGWAITCIFCKSWDNTVILQKSAFCTQYTSHKYSALFGLNACLEQ